MAVTNVIGSVVPNAEQQKRIEDTAKQIAAELRPWGIILKPEDRSTFLKPRIGGEKLFDLLINLAEENSLNIATLPISDMKADVTVARAAEGIERELNVAQQLAADTRLAAYGEAWQAFLGYYGVLSSMASRDPDLAKRLGPITDFMSRRRVKPAPEKPE